MATIKRGKFIRLPGGAGSIKIERSGAVVYKAPAAKKKNPTKRGTIKRATRALAAYVRKEVSAGRVVKRGASFDRKKNGTKKKRATTRKRSTRVTRKGKR